MKRSAAALSFLVLLAQPALAQSSLGFRTGEVSAAFISQSPSGSGTSGTLGLRGDFAITANHGFQVDVDYADAGSARIGTLAGHLYMTPRAGRKYGLFFSYGDLDGVSATISQFGAEGDFALGAGLSLEGRAGIGVRNPGSTDYIFAGLGLTRAVGKSGRISAKLDIADFEETEFSTTALDGRLVYEQQLRGTPASISLTVGAVGLDGSGSGQGGAYVGIGLSFRLGRGGPDVATQLFGRTDPITMLHRIGVF